MLRARITLEIEFEDPKMRVNLRRETAKGGDLTNFSEQEHGFACYDQHYTRIEHHLQNALRYTLNDLQRMSRAASQTSEEEQT